VTPLDTFYTWAQGSAFVFALLVGSFLNVCIARMPEDRSVVHPPSHCPACGARIRPWDNIPVVSWLLLRGRCRDCASPISSLYPTIELLTGLLGWLLFRRIVPGPGALDLPHLAAFGVYFVFVAMLVAQTFIDVKHYIIPDELSIYAAPFGILACVGLGWLGYGDAPSWRSSVVGAAAGGGVLLAVMGLFYLVRRKEGMGLGDVKLLAMIGAFLGALPAVPFVLFTSALAGSLVGVPMALLQRRGLGTALPFGPFLALGAIAWLLHGPEWTERLFPGLAWIVANGGGW
jgi:leader peptidase (prepilin peptidase)/N-methyltransferase